VQKLRVWLVGIVVTLLFAGCDMPSLKSPTSAGKAGDNRPETKKTIAGALAEDTSISIVADLLQRSGLWDSLTDESARFTFFAPNNAAFQKISQHHMDLLGENPRGALRRLLAGHVLVGAYSAQNLQSRFHLQTSAETSLFFGVNGDTLQINDSAQVLIADIAAENGFLHIINRVILPDTGAAFDSLLLCDFESTTQPQENTNTLFDVLHASTSFSSFVGLVKKTGLEHLLRDSDSLTAFVPGNSAFSTLSSAYRTKLSEDTLGEAKRFVLNHLVYGHLESEQIKDGISTVSVAGHNISSELVSQRMIINKRSKITSADWVASNGIVHYIDEVILLPGTDSLALAPVEPAPTDPPQEQSPNEQPDSDTTAQQPAEPQEPKDLFETLSANTNYSSFVSLIELAGLADTIAQISGATIFVPNNKAMRTLPVGHVDSLKNDPEGALQEFIRYHTLSEAYDLATLSQMPSTVTLTGSLLYITVWENRVYLNCHTIVTSADIQASNGFIHTLDRPIDCR